MARVKKVKTFEEELKDFIIKNLRRAFRKSPLFGAARNKAKEEFFIESKKGKPLRRVRFICAHCNGRFVDKPGEKQIAVDHIHPVIAESGFVDYNTYIERLFCQLDNLQVLCKDCHSIKTKAENEQRRIIKNAKRTT